MSKSNVIKLAQPGAFNDSLTEILRSGARTLLGRSGRPAVQKLNAWTAVGSLGRGNITKSPEYPYNVAFEVF